MTNGHSLFSPSKAARYMLCPGSIALEHGLEDHVSPYAMEGTAAHALAEMVLTGKVALAEEMIGETILWIESGKEASWVVTENMAKYVEAFCEDIKQRVFDLTLDKQGYDRVELRVEQKIDISNALGVPKQFGTADVVIAAEHGQTGRLTLIVADLKTGRGVEVSAKDNEQLMLYAAGVIDEYTLAGYEIDGVLVVINQVQLSNITEAWYSPEDIASFVQKLKIQVHVAQHGLQLFQDDNNVEDLVLNPGEKQCRFCKAKAICPAARASVASTVYGGQTPITPSEFEDLEAEREPDPNDTSKELLEWLGACMSQIDFIEDWCKAVRKEVYKRLQNGQAVPGYKLVRGKQGDRRWTDDKQVEELLKSMRLKIQDMYSMKLISPTQAEKLLKATPRRWNKLRALITRKDGSASVAPESDKRPAIVIGTVADEFEDLPPESLEDDMT